VLFFYTKIIATETTEGLEGLYSVLSVAKVIPYKQSRKASRKTSAIVPAATGSDRFFFCYLCPLLLHLPSLLRAINVLESVFVTRPKPLYSIIQAFYGALLPLSDSLHVIYSCDITFLLSTKNRKVYIDLPYKKMIR